MFIRSATVVAALLLVGCEPPAASSTVASAPPGPPPAPVLPTAPDVAAQQPSDAGVAEVGTGEATAPSAEPMPISGAASQQPVEPSTPPASSSAVPLVNLSAGVAVPQSLPEGTQMGVSVDYRLRGSLKTSSRYVLVVESNAGETAVPVTLSPEGGTLQGFLPLEVRPEHQPFQARIDEIPPGGKRSRVSNTVSLATSY